MRRIDFCKGWTFSRNGGAARTLDLPHDAQLEEHRSPREPSGSGGAYFAGGSYTYEKRLDGSALADKAVLLQFDGVYRKAKVFLNGSPVGGSAYGYVPFWADLSGRLKPGENLLRVTVDNTETPNSRWYSGAGIYRRVWLWTGEPDHIVPEGVSVTTLSYDPATVRVETEICGRGKVKVEILDTSRIVASGTGQRLDLTIPDARLWSAETPELYECRVSLSKAGDIIDSCSVTFGIRKLEWSTSGFYVNGQETLLRGGCVHHDNGILGAVTIPEAEERKVRKLKALGFNAIRSAHNPASPELIEACDRLGMYVMDEMWDMWYRSKTTYDYALDFSDNWQRDMEASVRRDRNHPSVAIYSIGNEVTEPGEARGAALARQLVESFHRLDPTRPVTAGINLALVMMAKLEREAQVNAEAEQGNAEPASGQISSEDYNREVFENSRRMSAAAALPGVEALSAGTLDCLDIAGYNYGSSRYPIEGEQHPARILVGSETFPSDIAANWAMVEKYPYLIGDFMWTAWDYLGEVGIGAWVWDEREYDYGKPYPWLVAGAGVLDILGDETAEAGLARAVFTKRRTPYIGVHPVNHAGEQPGMSAWRCSDALPCWSWRGCEGRTAEVEVYTAAQEVRLLCNGISVGRKTVTDKLASFSLPYASGELAAVAYDAGREVGRHTLRSATGELGLNIYPESPLKVSRHAFIRVDIADRDGNTEANADALLEIHVAGARLLAFGSAAPKSERSYLEGRFPSHYGRAMAVILPLEENVRIDVKASSGLVAHADLCASQA